MKTFNKNNSNLDKAIVIVFTNCSKSMLSTAEIMERLNELGYNVTIWKLRSAMKRVMRYTIENSELGFTISQCSDCCYGK